jgi:signal transduction histidine kinase
MKNTTDDAVVQPSRDKTDANLQLEREKADEEVRAKREVEEERDEAVRQDRECNDEVIDNARAAAPHVKPTVERAKLERERILADAVLEHERAEADALLERERAEREQYLADFLASERENTDEALNLEREQADAAMAVRDEFLATVSHDLKSLLGGLHLNAELTLKHADNGPAGEKVRTYATRSLRLVARINRLANDLYDVASIDAGKLAIVPKKTNLADLLRDTFDAFEPVAAQKSIKLETGGSKAPHAVNIDAGRILQVLANLVSNAIRFTPEGGFVRIVAQSKNNEIEFIVTDSGIGIPDDAVERVFERFSQLRTGRRGLGIGLYISKCIVEAHGGKIWVVSKLGAGSTFHFTLRADATPDGGELPKPTTAAR